MNFYDGKENNRDIIKNYYRNSDYIKVNYLYNDSSYTYNYSKTKEEEIINLMIEQALKRDEELYDKIYKETKIYLSQTLLSIIPLILCLKEDLQLLLCLTFIAGLISSMNLSESYEKLKEMKKFRLYHSMKKELDKPENLDITKIIEFDPMYREPINIGTLDKFSYNDVKMIKKELKRRNDITNDAKRV